MRLDDSFDDVAEILAGLAVHDASPERAARIRARCTARLARTRRRRARRIPLNLAAWGRWLEPAAALALSAVYLLSATGFAVRLWR